MGFIDPVRLPEVQPKAGWHAIDAGAALPRHQHPNEEVWHVIDGSIELTLGDETRTVHAGEALVVAADVPHAAQATEPCRVIVVDHPVRHEVAGLAILPVTIRPRPSSCASSE